jgi:hypothetical protein
MENQPSETRFRHSRESGFFSLSSEIHFSFIEELAFLIFKWIPAFGAVEKAYFPRNPVMPSRTKATIIYKMNQACRGSGYLCGTPECLRTLQN